MDCPDAGEVNVDHKTPFLPRNHILAKYPDPTEPFSLLICEADNALIQGIAYITVYLYSKIP